MQRSSKARRAASVCIEKAKIYLEEKQRNSEKNQQKQYDPGQLVEVCKILGVETVVIDDIRDKVGKQLNSLYHNVDALTNNEIETIQKEKEK